MQSFLESANSAWGQAKEAISKGITRVNEEITLHLSVTDPEFNFIEQRDHAATYGVKVTIKQIDLCTACISRVSTKLYEISEAFVGLSANLDPSTVEKVTVNNQQIATTHQRIQNLTNNLLPKYLRQPYVEIYERTKQLKELRGSTKLAVANKEKYSKNTRKEAPKLEEEAQYEILNNPHDQEADSKLASYREAITNIENMIVQANKDCLDAFCHYEKEYFTELKRLADNLQ